MNKIINKKYNKNEPWFQWLTRELNSFEAFQDFASGKNPEDVAEDFISNNSIAISQVFEDFDEEDKDTLDQFLKLTECEWHVFRILEKQIELRNKIRFVDFKKRRK
ncbi:MAG: restriction endonuclease subunit S [Prochlorococcus marinus CUG1439]|uniref:restriction endonuclease subunit S n=1 Tax=Prochlorococcus sp. MIT 1314 TaxID=3096220 RepID=UPI001B144A2B|nr:restriction endonuclease subunit S [Prochlorococcus sp. MIT 1314]MCR8538944.1 restriction endonuclease subunit S [Prochlorococcus marinus CUG1439]